MSNDVAPLNWKEIHKRWKKHSNNRPAREDNSKREESIGILQKRYGYTKERAASELDEHYPKARLC